MSETFAAPDDPDRPRAVLEEVLARAEFHRDVEQSFPWFEDLLRRLFGAMSSAPEWVGSAVTSAVLLAAAAFVLYVLWEGGAARRRRHVGAGPPVTATVAASPAARSWFDAGRRAFDEGRHADAVILLFRGIVSRLAESGYVLPDPSRTNGDHLRDLRERPREEALLRATIPTFERVRYGNRSVDATEARALLDAASALFAEGRG